MSEWDTAVWAREAYEGPTYMGKVMQDAPGLSATVWQRSACDLAGLLKLSLHIPYGMGSI